MRKRLRKMGAVIGAAAMTISLAAPAGMAPVAQAAEIVDISKGTEREINFNKGWKFFLETEGNIDASAKNYDDSAWRGAPATRLQY